MENIYTQFTFDKWVAYEAKITIKEVLEKIDKWEIFLTINTAEYWEKDTKFMINISQSISLVEYKKVTTTTKIEEKK